MIRIFMHTFELLKNLILLIHPRVNLKINAYLFVVDK